MKINYLPIPIFSALLILFACNPDDQPEDTTNFIDQGFEEIWKTENIGNSNGRHFSFLTKDYVVVPIQNEQDTPSLTYEYFEKDTGIQKVGIDVERGYDWIGYAERMIYENVFSFWTGSRLYHVNLDAATAVESTNEARFNNASGFEDHFYWGDHNLVEKKIGLFKSDIGMDNIELISEYSTPYLLYLSSVAGLDAEGNEIIYSMFKKSSHDLDPDTIMCSALDLVSKKEIWRFERPFSRGISFHKFQVLSPTHLFISGDDEFIAIDKFTGELAWTSDIIKTIYQQWESSHASEDRFIISDQKGDLVAFNVDNGEVEWRRLKTGTSFSQDLSVIDEYTVGLKGNKLFGYDRGRKLINCLNLDDGSLIWQVAHPIPNREWNERLAFSIDPDENILYINNAQEILAVRYP